MQSLSESMPLACAAAGIQNPELDCVKACPFLRVRFIESERELVDSRTGVGGMGVSV